MAGNLVKKVMLKIVADDGDTESKLDRISAKADELGRKHPDIKVKVDSAAASAKLALLRRELRDTGKESDQAGGRFRALGDALNFLTLGLSGGWSQMGTFEKVMTGMSVATGLGEPLVAGLTVGVMGLTTSLAAAGGGLGVFALAAEGAWKQVTAADTANKKLTGGLGQMQSSLKAATRDYDSWVRSASGGVGSVIGQGLRLLPGLLRDATPVLAPVESALHGIIGDLGKSISGGGLKTMFTWIAANAGPAITGLLHAIANIGVGFGGMLRAFTPASHDILHGLDDITAKFAHWGETLGSHSGFQSLMSMFRSETPLAMNALKSLAGILKTVVSQMTGMSTFSNSKMLLQLAGPVLAFANALLKAHPQLVWLVLYLKLASDGLGKLKGAFSGVKSGIGDIKSVTTALGNLKKGASDSEAAASDATGAWGTFGGQLSKLKISNLTAGFKDADAAASDSTGVLGTLGGKASSVWSAMGSGASAFGGMIAAIPGKIGTVVEAIKGWSIWSAIASGATKVWTGIQAAFDVVMDANPVVLIVLAIVGLVAAIVLVSMHVKALREFWKAAWHDIVSVFDVARHAIAEGFDFILHVEMIPFEWLKANWPLIVEILTGPVGLATRWVISHWAEITSFTRQMVSDVVSFFASLPGKIGHELASLGSMLYSIGRNAIMGLVHGIEDAAGAVAGAVGHLASLIPSGLSKILSIFSPSRVTYVHGQMVGQGLANGMLSMRGKVGAAAVSLGRAASLGTGTAAALGGAAGGSSGGWFEARLVVDGGALSNVLGESMKLYVRRKGGGGPASAQRALGRVA